MICKRLLKFTFSGLLLAVALSAYAEGEKVVKLANDLVVTWEEFAKAINNPSTVSGSVPENIINALTQAETDYTNAQNEAKNAENAVDVKEKEYNDARNNLANWQSQLTTKNTDYNKKTKELSDCREQLRTLESSGKVTVGWLNDIIGKVSAFKTLYDAALEAETEYTDSGTIYYKYAKKGVLTCLYLSFNESYATETGWVTASESALYSDGLGKTNPNKVYFDLGEKYTATSDHFLEVSYGRNEVQIMLDVLNSVTALASQPAYQEYKNQDQITELNTKINTLNSDIAALDAEMTVLNNKINDLATSDSENKTGLDKLYDAWQTAKTDLTAANNKVDEAERVRANAQTAYDQAMADAQAGAIANYKEVTLVGDVTATEALTDFDGVMYGEGHVITLSGPQELFKTFRGRLMKVAVNGDLAQGQASSAIYNNVATWMEGSGKGAFYDKSGNETECDNIGRLGFIARDCFGVDYSAGALTSLNDASKIYSITVYTPNSSTHNYVQIKDSGFVTGKDLTAVGIPANMFVKSETTDLTGFVNVFFNDGSCEEVVITDRKEFYCPVDITAKKVTLNREFSPGMNALCLPFELTNEMDVDNIEAICRYDKETPEQFWFKKVGGTVPANTPVLLVAKANFKLDLSNVAIKKTDSQFVIDEGDEDDPSKSYGIFTTASREEFKGGASESYKVYGLKDGEFRPAGENATFPAFRMVIYSDMAQPSGVMSAPRRIAIVDEKGVEITDKLNTGVGSLKSTDPSLNIVGGTGEITFNSDVELGKVEIYTVDGKLAAVADVFEGTTNVNLQSGLYIVMGRKVVVK